MRSGNKSMTVRPRKNSVCAIVFFWLQSLSLLCLFLSLSLSLFFTYTHAHTMSFLHFLFLCSNYLLYPNSTNICADNIDSFKGKGYFNYDTNARFHVLPIFCQHFWVLLLNLSAASTQAIILINLLLLLLCVEAGSIYLALTGKSS